MFAKFPSCDSLLRPLVTWNVRKTTIAIEGMVSLDCGIKIARELSRLPKVQVGVAMNYATIEHEECNPEVFLQAIQEAGKYTGRITSSQRIF